MSSRPIGFTPSGRVTSLRCFELLISSPATSTSIDCGMRSGGQRSGMEWVTMFTAPPRFTPGDCSELMT